MNLKRLIRGYAGFQFFFSLLLWLPVFYDYQRAIGLSDPQIFSIQSIYYLFFCFLEIPTGHLADRWGYQACMKLGALVLTGSNLLPVFFPSYAGLLFHFLTIALARSLISGASSAYLYDALSSMGRSNEYKRIEGSARAYGLIGKVVFWAGMGVVMKWQLTLPYWMTAVASAISVGFAWSLPELTVTETRGASQYSVEWKTRIRSIGGVLVNSPVLVLIMLQGIAVFVLSRICQVNLFQPILREKSFSLEWYGLVMSMMTVFEAIGSARPQWIRRWMSDVNAVFFFTFVMAASLSLTAASGGVGVVIWLNVFSLAAGFSFPIQRQLLNDAILDSRYRATLLSIESLIDRAACAWVAAVLAQYLESGRIGTFLYYSAVVSSLGMILVFVALRWAQRHSLALKHFDKAYKTHL